MSEKRTRAASEPPRCDRMSCFANKAGLCNCLSNNEFTDKYGNKRDCAFYQPWSIELARESEKRIGWNVKGAIV